MAALEYARRLEPLAQRLAPDLLVVMRVYFEKPRTVVGWKGLINDPALDGSFQINRGLRLARQLLLDVTEVGLPIATEFLDTTLGQYYADLISWGAIGARTVESQIHRELASGLSMPVGFKNRTDGDLQVAVDAIMSAQHPHSFPSLTHQGAPAVLTTSGNEHGHLVLRGGSRVGPNFEAAHIAEAKALLQQAGAPAAILVDCSHANSGKRFEQQPAVAANVAAADRGRRARHHRRDAGKPPGRRHPEGGARTTPDLRTKHHRRLPGVRRCGAGAGRPGASGARTARLSADAGRCGCPPPHCINSGL